MSHFWSAGGDLPDDCGFRLFGRSHILMLLACTVLIFMLCLLFRRLNERSRTRLLRICTVCLLAGDIARDIFLAANGQMGISYLPLHLCSLSMYFLLIHSFLPECFFSRFLGEISVVLFMPGALAALLFPNWTRYPLISIMSLHSFAWHSIIIAYALMLLIGKRVRPTIRHYFYPVIFLAVITLPIQLFNLRFGTNYLFANVPSEGTPLMLLYSKMGSSWRIGYAALVAALLLMIYLIIELLYLIKNRRPVRDVSADR